MTFKGVGLTKDVIHNATWLHVNVQLLHLQKPTQVSCCETKASTQGPPAISAFASRMPRPWGRYNVQWIDDSFKSLSSL